MNHIHETVRLMNKVLGDYAPQTRAFVVDMHDEQGNDSFIETILLGGQDVPENEILEALTAPLVSQKFIVDAVYELLDGYTNAELSQMVKSNIDEARKHVKMHYLNFDYVPEVLRKYPAQVEDILKQQ